MCLDGRRWPYAEQGPGGDVDTTGRTPHPPDVLVFGPHLPELKRCQNLYVVVLGLEIQSWCLWVRQQPGALLPVFAEMASPHARASLEE